MRVNTYFLVVAGLVLAATAHKTTTEPLKQRLAEKGQEGTLTATTNAGIIDKAVSTSHIKLAQASNDLRSGVMSTTMNTAATNGQASSETKALNAAGNLRQSLEAESKRSSGSDSGSGLRGVYAN
jgi:hypothetical protein